MKFLFIVLCLIALPSSAFDSVGWMARRARLDADALRLRVAFSNCVASLQRPAENLQVPIENYPDGSVRVSVHANRAQFFIDEGFVWGKGVVLREYGRDGKVTAELEAEQCVVDRNAKSGWAEGKVHARYGKTTVDGEGIYFSFTEEFVKILSRVEIVANDVEFEGVKL